MPRPTSFDRVCCPKAMMQATPDIVLPYSPFKNDYGMPHPTTFDCLCCPKVMMACHARRRSTVLCWPKAMMACHARRSSTVCAAQR